MPEPTLVSVGLLVAKKGGPRAATELYKRVNPQDWATRLAKTAFDGQPGPRPRRAFARVLRRKGMLERLAAAVSQNGEWVDHHIIGDLDSGLGRSWRWRRLGTQERHRRAQRLAQGALREFVAALDPARAVAVALQATQTSLTAMDRTLQAQGVALERAVADQGADQAQGRLARLRERLDGLPEVVRPVLEDAMGEEPQGVEDIVISVCDPDTLPAESVRAWVDQPPTWLGDHAAPQRPIVWSVLGELAAAYGQPSLASAAFENAVRAGSGGRRAYWLARAAWAAILDDDGARASTLLAAVGTPEQSPEPAVRVIAALQALLARYATPGRPSITEPGALAMGPVAPEAPDQDEAQLRNAVRRELASWTPTRPVDLDLAARVAVQVEISDASRTLEQRYTAILVVLDHTLSNGWIADTALLVARVLCWRVGVGGASNRAKDLSRAEELALTVRDQYRSVRRDARVATREAVMAAALSGKHHRVIELGSAHFGEATPAEAHDPETACAVVEAALQHDPATAQAIVDDPAQLPEGYVRAWARAMLATRRTTGDRLARPASAALWREVFDAASTDNDRWQALNGLADVGAEDLPQLDDIVAETPWMADQLRARSALNRGDAQAAIRFAYPHRGTAAAAAAVLADGYVMLGELDAAVETLQEAAERFDFDDLTVHAASICAQAGQTQRAEQLVIVVLGAGDAAWSGRSRALALLGELQAARGAWEEAITSWTTALETDPHAEQVRWQLAGAHARRGEHDKAWSVLTADPDRDGAIRVPPDPPTAVAAHLLLVLLYRRGDLAALVGRGIEFLERFRQDSEVTGRMTALLVTATADDKASELAPNLQDRLQAEVAAVAVANPTTSALRVIAGTTTEQLQQMIELVRPDPEYVRTVEEIMVQVTRGQMPLGVLARAGRRPYAQAVVEHLAGVLCAVGDQAEHAAGVADACAVLGIEPVAPEPGEQFSLTGATGGIRLLSVAAVPVAEVVTDASTLFVRGLLPDVDARLTAGIRELILSDDANVDLITACDHLAMNTSGSFHVDPRTGQGGIQPVVPRIRQLHRNSLAKMAALAASCRKRPTPTTSHPDIDKLQVDGDAQVSGLRLAAARRAALWADDVALRQLARMVGIPAFSTAALLDACATIGRLTRSECDCAIEAMVRGNVGDFAPNLRRARKLAAEHGDARGAMLGAMAKPAFWSDSQTAVECFAALVADLHTSDRSVIADLVYVSVQGICRTAMPDAHAIAVASRVIAQAMITVGDGFGDIPTLLLASRSAVTNVGRPLPDLLPHAATEVLKIYEETLPPALAANQLRVLVARCSDDDTATIRRVILEQR